MSRKCWRKDATEKNHAYYYQVQFQIFISEKDYCDFIVWTTNDYYYERIEPDEEFWSTVSVKAKEFFEKVIILELIGKHYSKPARIESGTVTSAVPTWSTADPMCDTCKQEDRNLICTCQIMYDPNGDSLIGYDNYNCPYKWSHYKCVNIKHVPKGAFYCQNIRK